MSAQPTPISKSASTSNVSNINEALNVLNGAASQSRDEIKNMIDKDYKNLRAIFREVAPEVRNVMRTIKDQSMKAVQDVSHKTKEMARNSAKEVDRSAHSSPWLFIGASSLVAAIGGFFLGRKLTRKDEVKKELD